ncbi:hypothetical protein [Rhodopseudomonas palustris]|uniref:Uncharacterized protein n=1 Tax=Rhodopseudomonas palustris (strain ATCC BAA-98 / CGA009) TaxID=258594 RepID=Q6N6Q0_RHOPA|nr:hypothetical protein [Rhodopseudomonas palustris]ACF01344.1 hypothetical protein Rpal_2836 [Rhodopseudomonas palustris TIE-1]OPF90198.1 hypothetical protein B1S06_22625 [Rhodopseudomonas palustris]PPQ42218.1 hypothetical protein CKO39_18725 [Rhodopseudomonas palustris]QLH71557.1 hypothetical protein HZF03_12460 [Rhodopseudomonas palustris]QQM04084.1 hypothetical protein I8G32_02634 [Rhodopseudomonas palustris]
MSVFRSFGATLVAAVAVLLVSDALFGDDSYRFDRSLYDSRLYAPRHAPGAATINDFDEAMTPAERIRETFSQFTVSSAKRYTSRATIIR